MKLQSILYPILERVSLGKFVGTFENVPYFASRVGALKNRAALALPGIGIFVHPDDIQNIHLLRHEFGHMLQAKIWGKFFFYKTIGWTSIFSARQANRNASFVHQHTWTEWSANLLSFEYFNKPRDWDIKNYPIKPQVADRVESNLPVGLTLKVTTTRTAI